MAPHEPRHPHSGDELADEHPRGTLVIVLIFGALFAAGWLVMFLTRFLAQGPPHH